MAKIAWTKRFRQLSTLLLSLLLLISLTMSPVLAKMKSGGKNIDKTTARVTKHMEKMRQKCPGIEEKKIRQVEEKLRNGTIRPKDACSHCHMK